jgi:hypothetical protein
MPLRQEKQLTIAEVAEAAETSYLKDKKVLCDLCALCSEHLTNDGADQLVDFCAALSGLEISGPRPRARALGCAVPPFQG